MEQARNVMPCYRPAAGIWAWRWFLVRQKGIFEDDKRGRDMISTEEVLECACFPFFLYSKNHLLISSSSLLLVLQKISSIPAFSCCDLCFLLLPLWVLSENWDDFLPKEVMATVSDGIGL
jgi:hypothetical protein